MIKEIGGAHPPERGYQTDLSNRTPLRYYLRHGHGQSHQAVNHFEHQVPISRSGVQSFRPAFLVKYSDERRNHARASPDAPYRSRLREYSPVNHEKMVKGLQVRDRTSGEDLETNVLHARNGGA
jgi:hypothetical protein